MFLSQETPDQGAVMAKTSTFAIYGGSGSAIFGGLSANELGVIGGIVIGIAGLALNWYYKAKHYQLAVKNAKHISDD